MRLKDGFQVCQQCGGSGCYWCQRQGWRAQCPYCANSEPGLLTKDDEGELRCLACDTTFEKNGSVLAEAKEPVRITRPKK